jgi:hypothetical protein
MSHGFFYENGTWSTLDASGGANSTFTERINNSDLIVGYYLMARISHGLTSTSR